MPVKVLKQGKSHVVKAAAIGKLVKAAQLYARARRANQEFYHKRISPLPKDERVDADTYAEWEELTKAQIEAERQLKEMAMGLGNPKWD